MLGRGWWTAISLDEVEDGSELFKNAVAFCKKFSFSQRDPGTCRGAVSSGTEIQDTCLPTLVFPIASLYLFVHALLHLPLQDSRPSWLIVAGDL